MATFTVQFTDKAGKPGKVTFPTQALASAYARTVKGASVVETEGASVAPVNVTACPAGTAEAQRAAARAYYTPNAGLYVRPEIQAQRKAETRAFEAENAFEREAEFWAASACAGQSREDAWADYDFAKARGEF